jgi:hypothetical protein
MVVILIIVSLLAGGAVLKGSPPYESHIVDDRFFTSADLKFTTIAELPVTAEVAFRALEDPDAWPIWYKGIKLVKWTSPKPLGAGATRDVTLSSVTLKEHFYRWEPGHRVTFYITSHSSAFPLFRALAEDYLLENLPGGHSRFTYHVAIDPTLALRAAWPVVGPGMKDMFRQAPEGLARYLTRPNR